MQVIPNLLIFGSPGSGKGTWSNSLQKLGYECIGMGNILREEIKKGSQLGNSLRKHVDGGTLIPDELAVSIGTQAVISKIHNQKAFVLEGFPSTVNQFQSFAATLSKLGVSGNIVVLHLECSDNLAALRISSRLICRHCLSIYNLLGCPPKQQDRCDNCNSYLEKRLEDTYEMALNRIQVFREKTLPIIDMTKQYFKVIVIDANKPFSEEFCMNILKAKARKDKF